MVSETNSVRQVHHGTGVAGVEDGCEAASSWQRLDKQGVTASIQPKPDQIEGAAHTGSHSSAPPSIEEMRISFNVRSESIINPASWKSTGHIAF